MKKKQEIRAALQPFGEALNDYVNGKRDAVLFLEREDGFTEELPVKSFFRGWNEYSKLEKQAIHLCKGKILDVGAGAGAHSLHLQKKGYTVYALDILAETCRIMEQRGVENVICSDFWEVEGDKMNFDTVLLLGRSICMIEDLEGLERFLSHTYHLLKENGRIILDSGDVTKTHNPSHLQYHQFNLNSNRYIGEVRLRFRYKGNTGKPYQLVHIEPNVLIEFALRNKFSCDIVDEREEGGSYLACLRKEA
ncbi:MAG: class I SAM-dependent methyltransferase [Promethearchaeia archaeon]